MSYKTIIGVSLIALVGILCLGAQSESFLLMLGKTMPVLNAPHGSAIGQLNESTLVKVLEEQDGYFRIQVEGWIPKPSSAATAPATPPPAKPAETKADPNKDLKEKSQDIINIMRHD